MGIRPSQSAVVALLTAFLLAGCGKPAPPPGRPAGAADPASAEGRYQSGLQLRARGLNSRALAEFRAVIRIAPEHVSARLAIAEISYEKGWFGQTVEQADRVLATDAGNIEAQTFAAAALGLGGEYRRCMERLDILANGPPPENEAIEFTERMLHPAWLAYETRTGAASLFRPGDPKTIERLVAEYEPRLDDAASKLALPYNAARPDEADARVALLLHTVRFRIILAWARMLDEQPEPAEKTLEEMAKTFGKIDKEMDRRKVDYHEVQLPTLSALMTATVQLSADREDDALETLERLRDSYLDPDEPRNEKLLREALRLLERAGTGAPAGRAAEGLENARQQIAALRSADPSATENAAVRRAIAQLTADKSPQYAIAQIEEARRYEPAADELLLPLANAWLKLATRPPGPAAVRELLAQLRRDLLDTNLDPPKLRAKISEIADIDIDDATPARHGKTPADDHLRRLDLAGLLIAACRPRGRLTPLGLGWAEKMRLRGKIYALRALITPPNVAMRNAADAADKLLERELSCASGRMILAMALVSQYRHGTDRAEALNTKARRITRSIAPCLALIEQARLKDNEADTLRKARKAGRDLTLDEIKKLRELTRAKARAEARAGIELRKAIEYLRNIEPDQAGMARAKLLTGEMRDASRIFILIARRLRSKSAETTLDALNSRRLAYANFKRLAAEHPAFEPATALAVELMIGRNPLAAADVFAAAIASKSMPKRTRHRVGLTVALLEAGHYPEAVKAAEDAINDNEFAADKQLNELRLLALTAAGDVAAVKALAAGPGPLDADHRSAYAKLAARPGDAARSAALGAAKAMLFELYGKADIAANELDAAREVCPEPALSALWRARITAAVP